MRSISALLACVFVTAASAAWADSRVFIVANQADGYGVDQCLAEGDKCGAHAARHFLGCPIGRMQGVGRGLRQPRNWIFSSAVILAASMPNMASPRPTETSASTAASL